MSIPAIPIKGRFAQSNQKHKNRIETPAAQEPPPIKETKEDFSPADEKVHLEFPYDDLELLYEYTLEKMGITNPFNSDQKDKGAGCRDLTRRSGK